MYIIGIAGRARAGKDTIAAWLAANRGALTYSFAAPIKHALEVMCSIGHESWSGPEKELPVAELGRSPRELAQTLGTEWGRRMVHPDIWVIAARNLLGRLHAPKNQLVVIPDVRFSNEATFVREHGILIHVYRDEADGRVGVPGHESERGVEFWAGDVIISNNGTIDELHEKLGALFPSPRRA